MTAQARNVIVLQGLPIYNEDGVASEAITPGHLVQGVTSISKHSTAGAATPAAYACERDEMGNGISVAYAINDVVKVAVLAPGDRVQAFIASGQNIAENARLESAGNGTLRVLAAGTPIARALDAVNNASGPSDARIRVEVI